MKLVKSAAAGAGKGIVATAIREVLRFFAGMTGSVILRSVAGSTPFTALIFAAVEQAWLTWRLRRDRIDTRGYVLGSVRNAGAATGSVLGAMVMAVALSVVPIIGTVIGLMIGSFLGSLVMGYGLMGILALAWRPDPVSPDLPTANAAP